MEVPTPRNRMAPPAEGAVDTPHHGPAVGTPTLLRTPLIPDGDELDLLVLHADLRDGLRTGPRQKDLVARLQGDDVYRRIDLAHQVEVHLITLADELDPVALAHRIEDAILVGNTKHRPGTERGGALEGVAAHQGIQLDVLGVGDGPEAVPLHHNIGQDLQGPDLLAKRGDAELPRTDLLQRRLDVVRRVGDQEKLVCGQTIGVLQPVGAKDVLGRHPGVAEGYVRQGLAGLDDMLLPSDAHVRQANIPVLRLRLHDILRHPVLGEASAVVLGVQDDRFKIGEVLGKRAEVLGDIGDGKQQGLPALLRLGRGDLRRLRL